MDSRTGKKIRMSRLFHQDGRALIVAYSHGILMGPRRGMATIEEMGHVAGSLAKADGLMVSPGMVSRLEEAFIGRERPSLIVHLDYQSFSRSILPYDEGATVELAQIEDVVAAGAVGVMTYLYIGYTDPEREKLEIARNARIARACERWGIILMVEPRSAREAVQPGDKSNEEVLGLYCRIAAEIGADLVKCIHPGDEGKLHRIVGGCGAPVLVAGGSRAGEPQEAYDRAASALSAGAAGLVYGRNIYEAADPALELDRYIEIVHGGQR